MHGGQSPASRCCSGTAQLLLALLTLSPRCSRSAALELRRPTQAERVAGAFLAGAASTACCSTSVSRARMPTAACTQLDCSTSVHCVRACLAGALGCGNSTGTALARWHRPHGACVECDESPESKKTQSDTSVGLIPGHSLRIRPDDQSTTHHAPRTGPPVVGAAWESPPVPPG